MGEHGAKTIEKSWFFGETDLYRITDPNPDHWTKINQLTACRLNAPATIRTKELNPLKKIARHMAAFFEAAPPIHPTMPGFAHIFASDFFDIANVRSAEITAFGEDPVKWEVYWKAAPTGPYQSTDTEQRRVESVSGRENPQPQELLEAREQVGLICQNHVGDPVTPPPNILPRHVKEMAEKAISGQ